MSTLRNIILPVVLFVLFSIFSPLSFSAQAVDMDPAELVKICEQQQLKIRALEDDRQTMALEIQRLNQEIHCLNETLDRIRSQIGNSRPGPTFYE